MRVGRSFTAVGFGAICCLVALLAASAPAGATGLVDPSCDGNPYPNAFQVFAFDVGTPDSDRSGDVSRLTSSGVACGTEIYDYYGYGCGLDGQHPPQGWESLNVRIEMTLPPGVQMQATSSLPDGAYAGTAPGNAAICAGSESIITGGTATIRVQQNPSGTDCPRDAVACYKGTAVYLGYTAYTYSWVTEGLDGTLTLITGPVHIYDPYGIVEGAGFTQFSVDLCTYVGAPDGNSCGDSSRPWIAKNGDPSVPYCLNGKGYYEVVVTNNLGEQTSPARSCVEWFPAAQAVTEPACEAHGNQFGLFDLAIDTPDSHAEHQPSGISARALACGSRIDNSGGSYHGNGSGTLFDRFDIQDPPGVDVYGTVGMRNGAFVGGANIDLLTWDGFTYYPRFVSNARVKLKVDHDSRADCPIDAIACYKGTTIGAPVAAHLWAWVTETSGLYTLTLGELHNDSYPASPAGVTKINNLRLCKRVGSPSGNRCGSETQPYLQANGDASAPDCANGNGLYSVTATNRDGQTTSPTTACVVWNAP